MDNKILNFTFCVSLAGLAAVFLYAGSVDAASLLMQPKTVDLKIGETFEMDVRVNTDSQAFNAAQATIQFSRDMLEVKSIDSSADASIFNFWLDGPVFSNQDGRINFIGGTTNGVSGNSIPILKILFRAKGGGEADIIFSDAAVTASDGSGTNILSTLEIMKVRVLPTMGGTVPTAAVVTPEPTPIVRQPVPSAKLPAMPLLSVPLYPDETKWHSQSSDFLVKWELPADISDISAALDQNKTYSGTRSLGLFDSKVFSALQADGVYYAHIRFKNNIGWGPAANYRIALDTLPPNAFTIESPDGFETDNPSPLIRFQTSDGLSGVDHYLVRVDNGEALTTDKGEITLPLQAPGKHVVSVKAVDGAGNAIEDVTEFIILPIASPAISFISPNVYVGEGGLAVRGMSLPDTSVIFMFKTEGGEVAFETRLPVSKEGNWDTTVDRPLKKGKYFVEITTQDQRGALSVAVKSDIINVRLRPLFIIGGFEVTQTWLFIVLIAVLLGGFGFGWFSYRLWRTGVESKTVIAARDVTHLFAAVKTDIVKMLKHYENGKLTEAEIAEIGFLLKKVKDSIEKTEKYIVENIKEISD